MRFHTTSEFQAVKRAAEEAYKAFDILADAGDDNSQEYKAADAAEGIAFDAVIGFPIVTPTELLTKLEWLTRRDWVAWTTEAEGAMPAALLADLRRLQGHPVSTAVGKALVNWRACHELGHLTGEATDAEAYGALMATPCTTPGDFMAKCYMNMLGEHGSTLHGEARDNMTGNMFDVDISKVTDEIEQGEIWTRAAYADLDASDLGANLLAYGLPHFSAECWMERADAIGMRVSVITGSEDGQTWFGINEDLKNEAVPDHVKRERDRLQRIWAFDCKARTALLVDEILRDWPQLAMKVVPVPADPVSEKAA